MLIKCYRYWKVFFNVTSIVNNVIKKCWIDHFKVMAADFFEMYTPETFQGQQRFKLNVKITCLRFEFGLIVQSLLQGGSSSSTSTSRDINRRWYALWTYMLCQDATFFRFKKQEIYHFRSQNSNVSCVSEIKIGVYGRSFILVKYSVKKYKRRSRSESFSVNGVFKILIEHTPNQFQKETR